MSEQTIPLTLTITAEAVDGYWLNLEIKDDTPDDGMAVNEAANLINAIYNIKDCEAQDPSETWDQPDEGTDRDIWNDDPAAEGADLDQGTADAQRRFAEQILNEGYVPAGPLGTPAADLIPYNVIIKIFKSHRHERYSLQVVSGNLGNTSRYRDRVTHTVDIDGTNSHTFNNPIISRPVMAWQGFDGPKIHITGNTAYWDGKVKGSLRAEFDTEWDEVIVTVTGVAGDTSAILGTDQDVFGTGFFTGSESGEDTDDFQDVECAVYGFYCLQYQMLQLNSPEKDESTTDIDKGNIDRFVNTEISKDGDDDDRKSETESCIDDCPSVPNEQAESNCYSTYDACVAVAEGEGGDPSHCVEALEYCLDNLDEQKDPECVEECKRPKCRQHVNETVICECEGEEESRSYYVPVVCPPGVSKGSTLQGSKELRSFKDCGRTDSANDPVFYEEKCCEPWPFDTPMPQCKEIVKVFRGTSNKAFKDGDYPEGTIFILVLPAYGECGKHTTTQILAAKNCCDGVSQIYWSTEKSATVVGGTSSAIVYVTGGKSPYTWKVRGDGFYTNPECTQRDVETLTNSLTIYTKDACGTCQIYVTDGCSSAVDVIKSTEGYWLEIDPATAPGRDVTASSYSTSAGSPTGPVCRFMHFYGEEKGYKYYQRYAAYVEGVSVGGCGATCDSFPDWRSFIGVISSHHGSLGETEYISRKSWGIVDTSGVDPFACANENNLGADEEWEREDQYIGLTRFCVAGESSCRSTAYGLIQADSTSTIPRAWKWVCGDPEA